MDDKDAFVRFMKKAASGVSSVITRGITEVTFPVHALIVLHSVRHIKVHHFFRSDNNAALRLSFLDLEAGLEGAW